MRSARIESNSSQGEVDMTTFLRRRAAVRGLVAAAATSGAFILAGMGASSALACTNYPDTFGGANGNGSVYTDTCGVFNLEPLNYNSHWHGWYYEGGVGWREGSAGDVWITTDTWGNPRLISGLNSGTSVKAQECSYCTAGVQTDEMAVSS